VRVPVEEHMANYRAAGTLLGSPKGASGWENASQCEELTAIFVTILKLAKTS
jgi:hypothetical protein